MREITASMILMANVALLKEKFTRVFSTEFCGILKQLLLRIIFGGCFRKENRGGERCAVTLVVSGFQLFLGSYLFSYLVSHETVFIA